MSRTITPIYAGLIALLFIALSARVILYRRANNNSLGDQGDKALLKRMRVHANCAEYAPFGLMLLLICEALGAPVWVMHCLCMMLLSGRLAHAYGFGSSPQKLTLRVLGTALTLSMLAVTAVAILGHGLF